MAKKKNYRLHSDLPVDRLHAVMTSERYLLTKEEMLKADRAEVVEVERNVAEDGSVTARMHMCSIIQVPAQPKQKGDREKVDKEMHIVQTTSASALQPHRNGQSFRFSMIMPLPANMGNMFTDMEMYPDSAGQGTDVDVEVRVDTGIPIIGAKLAKSLLEDSEESVGNGLRRAERLEKTHGE